MICLLCARYHAEHFEKWEFCSFDFENNPVWEEFLLSPCFWYGSWGSGRLGNLLKATQRVRSGAGFRARQAIPELAFLLIPVVTTVLSHYWSISVRVPSCFEDLTQKPLSLSSLLFLLSSPSLIHHCFSSDFPTASPLHPPLLVHSRFPACIVVIAVHIVSSFLNAKLFKGKVPLFPSDNVLLWENSH